MNCKRFGKNIHLCIRRGRNRREHKTIKRRENMERNKVKISCNPYSKEIVYKRWGCDKTDGLHKWIDLGGKSSLVNEKYTKATIQHNAYEIVREINRQYNQGNIGLDIVFEGTIDDYYDLKNIVKCYYNLCDIQLMLGERYILIAEDAMPQIQTIFGEMRSVFEDYSDDDVKDSLNRFDDASKTTIPICVMGLYSSGKSAFINSLIGKEILPSASDPTTAKNYRISSNEELGKIKFKHNGEAIELEFDGKQYKSNLSAENDLIFKLQSIIKDSYGDHNQEIHMYKALQIINYYDSGSETDSISDLIEIEVPFHGGILQTKDYEFVIYDTPGSNSTSNSKHLDVLKESLEGQTNGLPVFVTTPDTMDSKDNDEIIDIIDQMGDALDKTNTLIVVNKSDEKDCDVLAAKKNKCEELKITKWKSTRIYFVSSIVGLGSKKKNALEKANWIDKTYCKVFKQQHDSFSDSEDEFYLQLYKYNIMPKARYEEICSDAEDITTPEELLYANSGILCVEKEIIAFANRYALYNKCSQAQDYLNDAIALTSKIISDRENEQEKLRDEINKKQEKKEKGVIAELEVKVEELCDKFTAEYPVKIQSYISEQLQVYRTINEKYINSLWEEYKGTNKDTRVSAVVNEAKKHFKEISASVKKNISNHSEWYWNLKHDVFQSECCTLVMENKWLTSEEKNYVKKYVMSIVPINVEPVEISIQSDDVSKYLIEIFGIKMINTKNLNVSRLIDAYNEEMRKYITNINQRVISSHVEAFMNWQVELKNGLLEKVTWLNPELRKYTIKLGELQEDIKKIKRQQDIILSNQKKIDCLLDYTYKEEC